MTLRPMARRGRPAACCSSRGACSSSGATLAVDVKVILIPPCIFHHRFSIQNIQGGVRMTLTSTPRRRLHRLPPRHRAPGGGRAQQGLDLQLVRALRPLQGRGLGARPHDAAVPDRAPRPQRPSAGARPTQRVAEGKIHRVDPKFASLPKILTENPYKSFKVDPNSGSTL